MGKTDPWRVHGYFFSICFGAFTVALVWLCAYLLDIPSDVPLSQALTPVGQVIFVCLLGVSAALAYLLARIASMALWFLIDALKRK